MTYKILKVMNNNVILVQALHQNEEYVLIGKGIGFGKKPQQKVVIPNELIEKKYQATDDATKESYMRLVQHIDSGVIGFCEELIVASEKVLGKLSATIHVVLTDHIAFAIERVRAGMVIDNPFLFEIKTLYPKEFHIAKDAITRINEVFDISLPEEEAGFIALHLYAAKDHSEVKEAVKQTRMMTEVMVHMEQIMQCDLKANEFAYIRLLNHLRGAFDRKRAGNTSVNPLLPSIKTDMTESFEMAKRVGTFIKEAFDIAFADEEIGYLAIHIERIRAI